MSIRFFNGKMKYEALFISLFIVFCWNVRAQVLPPKKIISKIELLAGPSLSFLRGSPYVDNTDINTRSLKNGYTLGLMFTNCLKRNFSLTGAVLYEKKGSISTFTSTYFDEVSQSMKEGKVENDYTYDYISIPLIMEYSIGKRNSLKFGAGIFTGYLLKQTMKILRTPQGPGGVEDQTDLNSHFDFGTALKIGYEIPVSEKISIDFQVLNTLGLINTRSDPNYGVIKSNNTSLLFGVIFKQ